MTIPEPDTVKWKGKRAYRCRLCAFDTFDKATFEEHYRLVHAPLEVIAARREQAETLHTMTKAELTAEAEKAGVTEIATTTKKADIIAAVEAAPKDEA